MTLAGRIAHRTATPVERHLGPVWTAGVAALVVTKATDLVTTVLGLVAVDGLVERNPVAATAVGDFGIPGLAALSLFGVVVVVLVVEWGVSWLDECDQFDGDPTVVYLVSYVPLSLLYGFTTVLNTALILTRVV